MRFINVKIDDVHPLVSPTDLLQLIFKAQRFRFFLVPPLPHSLSSTYLTLTGITLYMILNYFQKICRSLF